MQDVEINQDDFHIRKSFTYNYIQFNKNTTQDTYITLYQWSNAREISTNIQ